MFTNPIRGIVRLVRGGGGPEGQLKEKNFNTKMRVRLIRLFSECMHARVYVCVSVGVCVGVCVC